MRHRADDLLERAAWAQRQGRLEQAGKDIRQAIRLYQQIGDHRALAHAFRQLADVERALNNHAAAEQYYAQAIQLLREEHDFVHLAQAIRHLGDLYMEDGKVAAALPCYQEVLGLYDSLACASPLEIAHAMRKLALCAERTGDIRTAAELWKQVRELYLDMQIDSAVSEVSRRIARLGMAECRMDESASKSSDVGLSGLLIWGRSQASGS